MTPASYKKQKPDLHRNIKNRKLNGTTMNSLPKLTSMSFALAAAAALAASTASSHAQGATATISDVPAGGGTFDYTITLKNTGADSLNSFWYGWTTSGNNLPSNPTGAANSRGWANDLDGNSIMWINSSGSALAPGQSGTFTFVSTSSPSAITALSSGESVAYVNGIDFSQGVTGDSTSEFSPTLVAAPEPSTLGLLIAGLFVMAWQSRSLAASRRLQQATPARANVVPR